MKTSKVAVLGASEKAGRYARLAQESLLECGYEVVPIATKAAHILGIPTIAAVKDLPSDTDTLTIYIGSSYIPAMLEELCASPVRRFIFNPGTECEDSIAHLRRAGKVVVEGCTLVMLKTGQFEKS